MRNHDYSFGHLAPSSLFFDGTKEYRHANNTQPKVGL